LGRGAGAMPTCHRVLLPRMREPFSEPGRLSLRMESGSAGRNVTALLRLGSSRPVRFSMRD
jgi:hypothetical protein